MNKNKRWKPEEGEYYYYVNSYGKIISREWLNAAEDNFRYAQNNCYKIEEEALKHLENLKTKNELRLLAEELNGDRIIDWNNFYQDKYYLFNDYEEETCDECLYGSCERSTQNQGTIYCLAEDFLNVVIERIGEERLIKMIKSGV